MKALTVKQPWASAIVFGSKDVENRTWLTHYRGPLWIHAAGKDDRVAQTKLGPLMAAQCRSAIIGRVDVVDCRLASSEWSINRWGQHGDRVYHWLLDNALWCAEAVPCKGALGLWTPDDALVKKLRCVPLIESSGNRLYDVLKR